MNKYTLGTVLGTALLGLLKRKLGSSIRLSKKMVSILSSENRFFMSYDGIPFTETITIKSSVPEIISINLEFRFEGNEQTAHNLVIIFDKVYTNNEIYQIIKDNAYAIMMKAWEAFTIISDNSGEESWGYLYTGNAVEYDIEETYVLVKDLLDPLIDNLLFFSSSQITNQEVIINSDTGEIYKKPESNLPKLRKR
jgi:hypothetical protein